MVRNQAPEHFGHGCPTNVRRTFLDSGHQRVIERVVNLENYPVCVYSCRHGGNLRVWLERCQ